MTPLEEVLSDAQTLVAKLKALVVPPGPATPPAPPVPDDRAALLTWLADKKLTLPVNAQGSPSGKARELIGAEILDYRGPYVTIEGRIIKLVCPVKGALTRTAKYTRNEVRYLTEFTAADSRSDTARVNIEALAPGQKLVIHQIHDADEPWVKIVADNTGASIRVRALVKKTDGAKDTEVLLSNGPLRLGMPFISTLFYDGPKNTLTAMVGDGASVRVAVPMQRTGKGGKAYFKCGPYIATTKGPDAEAWIFV